jgi:hypothetical protein
LNRKHEAPLRHWESICEVIDDPIFRQRGKMLRIDFDFFQNGGWAERLAGLICGLTDIGHPCCDVNESNDLGVVPGLSDDCTAPGMTYQNYRPVLKGNDPTCSVHVVHEGSERILNCDDVKAPCFQDWNNLSPTRAIGEGPMNQNDVLDRMLL